MEIDQKLFFSVPISTDKQNPCSPSGQGPEWQGVIIRAPEVVAFKPGQKIGGDKTFTVIPICGYYSVPVSADPNEKPMRLIAVDQDSQEAYSGDVFELDSGLEPPPLEMEIDPEELKGLAIGAYFNPNLLDFVPLPQTSAIYDVHTEFRGFTSNVVTIRIVEEEE